MDWMRIVHWAALVVALSVVLGIRPSLPLDGDEGRNGVYNAATSVAGLFGVLAVTGLWPAATRRARVLLAILVVPLLVGGSLAAHFLLRG